MKQWLRQFMAGRYGVDQLSMAMAICSMVLMLVSRVFRLRLLYWIAVAMLAAMVFRSYSRNTAKRYQENQWFIGYFKQLRRWAAGLQNQWQENICDLYLPHNPAPDCCSFGAPHRPNCQAHSCHRPSHSLPPIPNTENTQPD